MYSRLVVPLICAAAVVFACGPRSHSTTAPASPAGGSLHVASLAGDRPAAKAAKPARPRRRGDTTAVDASFDIGIGDDGVRLELLVVNQTKKKLEIDFPDGRTRDFVVFDASGREVWRWSRGRLFTQTVQNKFLGAGDTATYEGRWQHAAPGHYTAVALLRSRNYPVEKRVAFDVHPTSVSVAAAH